MESWGWGKVIQEQRKRERRDLRPFSLSWALHAQLSIVTDNRTLQLCIMMGSMLHTSQPALTPPDTAAGLRPLLPSTFSNLLISCLCLCLYHICHIFLPLIHTHTIICNYTEVAQWLYRCNWSLLWLSTLNCVKMHLNISELIILPQTEQTLCIMCSIYFVILHKPKEVKTVCFLKQRKYLRMASYHLSIVAFLLANIF